MTRRRNVGVALLIAGMSMVLLPAAQAAPVGGLKQFRVPTSNSSPYQITQGSDGNLWFTEGYVLPPQQDIQSVGRITTSGSITEYTVCHSCFPGDIVQGPNGILYFTKNDPNIGRITTSGQVLPDIAVPNSLANGNGLAISGNTIWMTAYNTNSIWRYNITSGVFAEYVLPTPSAVPFDIAVAPNGIVWFTEFGAHQIGRLDPVSGVITETGGVHDPRHLAIASDGSVWFTERFGSVAIGRLTPSTNQLTQFPLAAGAGPEDIAAAPDGSLWFTQYDAGNIARITSTGTITQGKTVKGSGPFGITVTPDGNPWYTELEANKIASFQLR